MKDSNKAHRIDITHTHGFLDQESCHFVYPKKVKSQHGHSSHSVLVRGDPGCAQLGLYHANI